MARAEYEERKRKKKKPMSNMKFIVEVKGEHYRVNMKDYVLEILKFIESLTKFSLPLSLYRPHSKVIAITLCGRIRAIIASIIPSGRTQSMASSTKYRNGQLYYRSGIDALLWYCDYRITTTRLLLWHFQYR